MAAFNIAASLLFCVTLQLSFVKFSDKKHIHGCNGMKFEADSAASG